MSRFAGRPGGIDPASARRGGQEVRSVPPLIRASAFAYPRIERGYWRFVHRNRLEDTEELRQAFAAGWIGGGGDALAGSAEIGGVMPTFSAFVELLEAARLAREEDE